MRIIVGVTGATGVEMSYYLPESVKINERLRDSPGRKSGRTDDLATGEPDPAAGSVRSGGLCI